MPHKLKLSTTLMAVLVVLLTAIGFSGRVQKTVAVTGNTAIVGPTSFDNNAFGSPMWSNGQSVSNSQLNAYAGIVAKSGVYTANNTVVLNQKWAAGFWIYRPSGASATTVSIDTNPGNNNESTSITSAITLDTTAGQWVHVTIGYQPGDKSSTSGVLTYLIGDRDLNTNLPKKATSGSSTKTVAVSGSSSTGYRFKFAGNDGGLVAMSNDSLFAQTAAYAVLIDRGEDGTEEKVVNDTKVPAWGSNSSNLPAVSNVYGGDQLTMRYYLNYQSATALGLNGDKSVLTKVHLNLADTPGG